MTVTGTYNGSAGTLTIPVSGTTNPGTDFGQLSATGAATLGGTLTLATASGFSPPVGAQYTILKAASVSGTFATVNGAMLSDRKYVISYTPTSVVATVEAVGTPAPTVTAVTPDAGPLRGYKRMQPRSEMVCTRGLGWPCAGGAAAERRPTVARGETPGAGA